MWSAPCRQSIRHMDVRICLYATVDLLFKHKGAVCYVKASPSQDLSRERLGRLFLVNAVTVRQAMIHLFGKCLGCCLMCRLELASPEEDDQNELCFAVCQRLRPKKEVPKTFLSLIRPPPNFLHFLRDASIHPCHPTTTNCSSQSSINPDSHVDQPEPSL